MEELVRITTSEGGKQVVSARELHKFLGVKTQFKQWMNRMTANNFKKGRDYVIITKFGENSKGRRGRPPIDYLLTIEMAKKIGMMQNSPKGSEIQDYFLAMEKVAQGVIEKPLTEIETAERYLAVLKREELLQKQLKEAEPKVAYAESVETSKNSILVRKFAKDLCKQGFNTGEKRLYQWFRDHNYLSSKNEPYQQYIDLGLFEILTRTVELPGEKEPISKKTTLVTGKGQVYFAEKIINSYET